MASTNGRIARPNISYRNINRLQRVSAAAARNDNTFATSDRYDQPLSARAYDRTLTEYKARNLNKLSWVAYRKNPIIWGSVELIVRATIGKESAIRHKLLDSDNAQEKTWAETIQARLEQWWHSEVNNWRVLAESVQRDLLIFGELVPIYLTNSLTGDVEVGFVDVNSIEEIVRDKLNTRRIIGIKVRLENNQERVLMLTRTYKGEPFPAEKPEWFATWQAVQFDRLMGKRIGEVDYWANNATISSTRGTGDFAQVIDPANDAVKIVRGITDRLVMNNRVYSHLKFPTAWQQKQINDALTPGNENYINPPRLDDDSDDLRIFGTTKDIEWEIKSPAVQATETVDVFKMALALFSSGTNIPLHWLGWGDELTYASATEIGKTAIQYMKDRQNSLRRRLKQSTNFQIDQWRIFEMNSDLNGIPDEVLFDYDFDLPVIDSRTVEQIITVMKGKADVIMAAKASGAIDDEEAKSRMGRLMNDADVGAR